MQTSYEKYLQRYDWCAVSGSIPNELKLDGQNTNFERIYRTALQIIATRLPVLLLSFALDAIE